MIIIIIELMMRNARGRRDYSSGRGVQVSTIKLGWTFMKILRRSLFLFIFFFCPQHPPPNLPLTSLVLKKKSSSTCPENVL